MSISLCIVKRTLTALAGTHKICRCVLTPSCDTYGIVYSREHRFPAYLTDTHMVCLDTIDDAHHCSHSLCDLHLFFGLWGPLPYKHEQNSYMLRSTYEFTNYTLETICCYIEYRYAGATQ